MIFSEKQVPTLGSSPRASFSGSCSLDLLSCNRMFAGSLRHKDDEGDHQSRKDGCRIKATESEPAVCDRFVEKITKRGTQWTRQNESAPEQQSSGDIGIEIGSEDQNQARGKDECAPFVAEPIRVGHPVAERRAQGLREKDRGPVEHLNLW